MLRKFYRFAYVTGTVMLIVSMLMSIVPAFPVFAAQGSTKTSAGSCANPVNKNHYVAGDVIVLDFQGFEPNSTHTWTITGLPSSADPNIVVASGTFTADANGDWCVDNAYVVQADDAGEYHVSVEGGKGDNYRVVQEPAPGNLNISVTKTPSVTTVTYPGEMVTFTVVVTNNETFDVAVTQKSDSVFTDIGSCATLTSLTAGQVFTCTFTGYVTGDPGTDHINTFTVGATAGQLTTTVSDNAVVHIQDLPALTGSVQKTANPISTETGGTVTFTVVVSNTSVDPIDLTSLSDSVYGDLNGQGDCSVPQTIAAGSSYSCSFQGTVSGNVGSIHTNTVTANVSMGTQNASWTDTADVTIVAGPALSLNVSKVPTPNTLVEPGGLVTFAITVENTSNVAVQLTVLSDSVFGDLDGNPLGDCTLPQTLAIGGSYSCSITANITADHTNTVDATITFDGQQATGSATASVTVTLRPDPTLLVVKTANPTSMDEPGGSATYTVYVTNTSEFPVRINSITDNMFGDLNEAGNGTCTGSRLTQILAGVTFSCTFTKTISGAGGTSHDNTVTVQVIDDLGKTASDSGSASVAFNFLPTISVSKTASPASVNETGGNTTFTITVSNTSNETVFLNSLTDSVFGNLSGQGSCSVPQTIAAGANYQCNFTKTLSGEPSTPHENVVSAGAEDSDGNPATASDNEVVTFLDQLPTITVAKTALTTTIDEPGGNITYAVSVTNTSGEAVTLISLNDDVFGDLDILGTCGVGGQIAAGATFSCEFTGLVTGNAGFVHTNTVTALARDNEGNDATGNDSATVTITNVPTLIQVSKTAAPTAVTEPGGNVTFTVTVNNMTNEQITLTNLVDDVFNDITTTGHDGISATTCATGGLIAGLGSYSCTFTAAVTGEAGFIHINTVTATAVDNEQTEATDSDSAQVDVVDALPTIQVIKLADPASVPAPVATVSYSVEVVNNSAESVTLESLVDSQFGDLNGVGTCVTGGIILAGESYSCSFDHNISGQSGETHTNVITATVVDNESNRTEGTDDAVVTFTDPPELVLVDPCSVGCDLPNVTGQMCNNGTEDYLGTIEWDSYVDTTRIGGGIVLGIPAGECVDLSSARQGNGLYSITVTLVDENERTLETSCGPLSCTQPPVINPTPVSPPTGTTTVFIPVTGIDFSLGGLIALFQNFGFGLIAMGLVLHGLSLNGNDRKKTKK